MAGMRIAAFVAGCLALASAPALGQEACGDLKSCLRPHAGEVAKVLHKAGSRGRLSVRFRPAHSAPEGITIYCRALSNGLRNALHEEVQGLRDSFDLNFDIRRSSRDRLEPPEVKTIWTWDRTGDGREVLKLETHVAFPEGRGDRPVSTRVPGSVLTENQRKCLFSFQAERRVFEAPAGGHLYEEPTFRPDARAVEYRAGEELTLLGRIDPAQSSDVSWWVAAWRDPVTREHRNLFAGGLDLSVRPVVQDADPHAVRRAVFKLGLEEAREAGNHAGVLSYLDRLAALGGAQPRDADYYRGEALYAVERYGAAREALERYALGVGKDGRYYDKTVKMLLKLEKREEAARRAREEAERREAERRAREEAERMEAARRAREAWETEVDLRLDDAKRMAVQRGLAALGHGAGVADGVLGRRARAALRAWQAGRGLEATGYLTEEQAETLIAVARKEAARRAREAREEAARRARKARGEAARRTRKAQEEAARRTRKAQEEAARRARKAQEEAARRARKAREEAARRARKAQEEAARRARKAQEEAARRARKAREEAARRARKAQEEAARRARKAQEEAARRARKAR